MDLNPGQRNRDRVEFLVGQQIADRRPCRFHAVQQMLESCNCRYCRRSDFSQRFGEDDTNAEWMLLILNLFLQRRDSVFG